MTSRKLVVISAGLRQPSSTRLLADQLATAVMGKGEKAGIALDAHTIEVRQLARHLINHLLTGFPSPELEVELDAIAGADAVIAVTPIFTASYSGLFKLFFDAIGQDQLIDTPVIIAATGGTSRHSLVLDHALRPMFNYLKAVVVPTAVFAAPEDWGGASASGTLSSRIEAAAGELLKEIGRRPPKTPGGSLGKPLEIGALLPLP